MTLSARSRKSGSLITVLPHEQALVASSSAAPARRAIRRRLGMAATPGFGEAAGKLLPPVRRIQGGTPRACVAPRGRAYPVALSRTEPPMRFRVACLLSLLALSCSGPDPWFRHPEPRA